MSQESAHERAVLSALVTFGGGLAVMGVCALLGLPSPLSVVCGLAAMLVVWKSVR